MSPPFSISLSSFSVVSGRCSLPPCQGSSSFPPSCSHPFRTGHAASSFRASEHLKRLKFVAFSSSPSQGGAEEGAREADTDSSFTSEQDLADKLAAIEAEAKALRAELSLRRGDDIPDETFSAASAKTRRIDGVGLRETMFFVGVDDLLRRRERNEERTGGGERTVGEEEGEGNGEKSERKKKKAKAPVLSKWGLSEVDVLAAEREEERAMRGSKEREDDEESDVSSVVQRRLLIGAALAAATSALALVDLPPLLLPPSKPLFFYLTPIVALRRSLTSLLDDKTLFSNLSALKFALRALPTEGVKENLLSASALLQDQADRDKATTLSFEILDYLNQANFSNYFDNIGKPSAAQEAEFSKFSCGSLEAALHSLRSLLSLMPAEDLLAAESQVSFSGAALEEKEMVITSV